MAIVTVVAVKKQNLQRLLEKLEEKFFDDMLLKSS
jgi:hypothetical protein